MIHEDDKRRDDDPQHEDRGAISHDAANSDVEHPAAAFASNADDPNAIEALRGASVDDVQPEAFPSDWPWVAPISFGQAADDAANEPRNPNYILPDLVYRPQQEQSSRIQLMPLPHDLPRSKIQLLPMPHPDRMPDLDPRLQDFFLRGNREDVSFNDDPSLRSRLGRRGAGDVTNHGAADRDATYHGSDGSGADASGTVIDDAGTAVGAAVADAAAGMAAHDVGTPLPRVQVMVTLAHARALFEEALERATTAAAQRFQRMAKFEVSQAEFIRKSEARAADYRLRGPGW